MQEGEDATGGEIEDEGANHAYQGSANEHGQEEVRPEGPEIGEPVHLGKVGHPATTPEYQLAEPVAETVKRQ